ncbi:histone protein [Streptomyces sp. NBC_01210]|uniref:histone protein n=1 Tax=Streptomyces sp. NBC_01210 TaxID=2903774 RepID=UPI002E104100|nr:histone protein [Streptomyces sp. NBC_01210]
MDDQTKVALAAAIVAGYVLGRTKKGKLALSVATYVAGRRFDLDPRQLAAEGMRRLGEIPQVAELQEQLKGEVLDAGRKAVTAAATRGMGTLADTLRDRTASSGKKDQEEPEDEEEYEDEEEPEGEEEYEDEEKPEDEEEEEEPEEPEHKRPQRRRSSRKPAQPDRGTASRRERAGSARSSSGAASKEPARRKKSSATKPAAKKAAPAKKSAARKQAPARKASSSGRAAKKTSKRADRRR